MEKKQTSYPVKFRADDMDPSPSRWMDRGIDVSQQAFFWWGYIQFPDRNPVLVMRCFTAGKEGGGMGALFHTECQKGMFKKPKMLDVNQVTDQDTIQRYHMIGKGMEKYGGPDDQVYEASACDGDKVKVLYRAGTHHSYIREGDFLELQGENMPYSMCIDPPGVFAPYFTWSAIYRGKYYGEDVTFMGGCDRFFSEQEMINLDDRSAYYWGNIISGIDANGRREYGCFYMYNGKTFAYYVKDGQDPKWSEDVRYKADWAYDPSNPDCVVPRSIVWGFDDVEVHWKAEYTSMYGMNTNLNHFGPWYEKNGSRDFVHYLGAFESNIKAEHIKKSSH